MKARTLLVLGVVGVLVFYVLGKRAEERMMTAGVSEGGNG